MRGKLTSSARYLRWKWEHATGALSRPIDSSVDNASGFKVLGVQSIPPKALADGHRLAGGRGGFLSTN